MSATELARAKINLTLRVLGRRADGYHALESLVSFASAGDRIALDVNAAPSVVTVGPNARAIDGPNLLERALSLLQQVAPGMKLGAVTLEKVLPVAAGLGGGSADVGALLRLLQRANPDHSAAIDWMDIGRRLGADVPVCLRNRPAMMWSIGERLADLSATKLALGPMPAVLVNPGVPLATPPVFKDLRAVSLMPGVGETAPVAPAFATVAEVVAYMRAIGNDLERPATRLLPVIANVKAALEAQAGCSIAALSGSGPTGFGLFTSDEAAAAAARDIAQSEPGWWVVQTGIDFPADAGR